MKNLFLTGSRLISDRLVQSAVAFAEEIRDLDYEKLVGEIKTVAQIIVGQDQAKSNKLLYFIRMALIEPRVRQKFMAALREVDRKAYVHSRKFF
jgi:hypothetical protein